MHHGSSEIEGGLLGCDPIGRADTGQPASQLVQRTAASPSITTAKSKSTASSSNIIIIIITSTTITTANTSTTSTTSTTTSLSLAPTITSLSQLSHFTLALDSIVAPTAIFTSALTPSIAIPSSDPQPCSSSPS
ncbi:hypothetical protein AA313_de0205298 [Arthrobotrys entomopaga]|nr:hypothetical protein AA313_de0205298 [Arthrobotrys entomopaga]